MLKDILLLEKQLCFRLYQTSRNMSRLYQPFLSKFNLTYPQYIVMLVMFEHEVIDFKELSTVVDLKTGTLTPIIQKLEKTGYVFKIPNKNDKRKINIEITKEGRDLKEKIIEVPIEISKLLPMEKDTYTTLVKELDSLKDLIKNGELITKEHE